jgi:poly(3-hydroxybutyrate) depolymerase
MSFLASQPRYLRKSARLAVPIGFTAVILLICGSCGGGGSSSSSKSNGLPAGSCTFSTGDHSCTMQHDSTTRHYVVHVPPQYVQNSSALIVALHPAPGTDTGFAQLSGWSSYADALPSPQPAVIYPQGLLTAGSAAETPHPAWNAFFSCRIFPQPCPDDSDFIRQIILTAQANIHMDPNKVYVTGFSLGSLMTGRVAVDHADLVAAVAQYEFPLDVEDGLGGTPIPSAGAKGHVAALYIDGDHAGGPNVCGYALPPQPNGSLYQSSVDQDMAYWTNSQNNNCSVLSTTSNFCTGAYTSSGWGIQTALTEKHASSCSHGADVQIYKLLGGTHTYYCSNNSGCSPVVHFNNSVCDSTTPCNSNLNSTTGTTLNDIIWNFFVAHPKQ